MLDKLLKKLSNKLPSGYDHHSAGWTAFEHMFLQYPPKGIIWVKF